jgi:hypothetical protein
MSSDLSAIAAFKQLRQPTPLASYLHIYQASYPLCYTDYMQGAAALAAYLAPIEIHTPIHTIPRMLRNYELHQLAKTLRNHTSIPLSYQQIEDAIYEYYLQLPR